ncbi:hypothetical protein MSG28_014422 [Choristoneura fumiferana]|uniref:Uncharacterized protein n=1 Tax=Choristoneura fumiferana TaxID=7141 RepID=A0ACC0JRC2_CHOFU|nr:hypothetical protein MSG28_014422 [Choristoneura fumiferana]
MSKSTKLSWKCVKCRTASECNPLVAPSTLLKSSPEFLDLKKNSDNTMNESRSSTDNVTFRKQRRVKSTSSSLDHTEINCSDTQTTSSCSTPVNDGPSSLPNLTESLQIHNLKEEIATLTTQLGSAHDEIACLNSEVFRLTKGYSELEAQIAMLKKLLDDVHPAISRSTPKSSKKKKTRKSQNRSNLDSLYHLSFDNAKNIKEHNEVPVTISTETGAPETTLKGDQPRNGKKRTIFLFGGKQCAGVAPKLVNMREDDELVKYKIMSYIKPSASTQQIVDTISSCKFSEGDKIVLSIGEHDDNPMEMMSSLNKALECLENYHVFIVSIRKSEGIKTDIVNYMLQQSCLKADNVKFIDILNRNTGSRRIFLNKSHKIVMCGDFNTNILGDKNEARDFVQLLNTYNLKCHVKEPTRVTKHSSTCIDNIVSNLELKNVTVIDLAISDHTLHGYVNYAIVGSLKRTDDVEPWQVRRIRRIIKHPHFNPYTKHNDIALLETDPISLGPSTVPACLDVFGGAHDRSVATGWGVTDYLGRVSDTLQKVRCSICAIVGFLKVL